MVLFMLFFITTMARQSRHKSTETNILQQEAIAAGMQPFNVVFFAKARLPEDKEVERRAREEAHAAGMHLEVPGMPNVRYVGPNGPATITQGSRKIAPVIYGDYCGTITLPVILYTLNLNSPENRQQLAAMPLQVPLENDFFTLQLSEAPPVVMPHPVSINMSHNGTSYTVNPRRAALGGKASFLDLPYWSMTRQDGTLLAQGDFVLPTMSKAEFGMFLTFLLTDLTSFVQPPVASPGMVR